MLPPRSRSLVLALCALRCSRCHSKTSSCTSGLLTIARTHTSQRRIVTGAVARGHVDSNVHFASAFYPRKCRCRAAPKFSKLLDSRRAQLSDVADPLAGIVTLTLKEWRAARTALNSIRSGASYADVVKELDAQLVLLLPPNFIETTPRPWLDDPSRYLKTITRRIERLPANVRRDAELAAQIRPFTNAMLSLLALPALSGVRPESSTNYGG